MRTRYQQAAWALAGLFLLGALLSGCGDSSPKPAPATAPASGAATGSGNSEGHKPVIVVSLFPIATLVDQLTDNWATVKTFMPAGANPHEYEPGSQQVQMLSDADVLITVGMHMDDWAMKAAKAAGKPNLKVLCFADLVGPAAMQPGLVTLESAEKPDAPLDSAAATAPATEAAEHHDDAGHAHAEGGPNNHLWMDPLLTDRFVFELGRQLEPLFPDHIASLHTRIHLVRTNLLSLHQEIQGKLAGLRNKKIVTFHNAYDLYAKRYGLDVITHLTDIDASPGGEVTPDKLVEAIEAVKKYHLHSIYAEPEFPDTAAQSISEETGARVYKLDDLGNPAVEGYRDYFELMRTDTQELVDGQSKAP